MYACVILLLCGIIGSIVADYPQRQVPYNVGPNDPYSVVVNPAQYLQEPSQRLFWSNGQGTNQVGGTGLWATLTNKFPFLSNMFGRLELPTEYGAPAFSSHYNVPNYQQYYQAQQTYQAPQTYEFPQSYQVPQLYQPPQVYRQPFPARLSPGRDVGFTDDAVIVTPPQVPIASAPAPQLMPEPGTDGYQYSKPQYRLELPQK